MVIIGWVPPDLSEACAVHTTITTCQSSTFLFLQLITQLFGSSRDRDYSELDGGFSEEFSNFFNERNFGSDSKTNYEEFDFIVIGAGSAGCVVANRLSEVNHWNVLLLEAGDEEPEVAEVPAFAPALQQSSIDWNYFTQPSPHSCLARDQGRCPWARGKVMGGSSTINYLIYIRGHPRDYDEWAEKGNEGWSYEEVLPYFKKSEDNRNHEHIEPQYHGVGGYLTVERFPYQDKNVIAIIDAYRELGLPFLDQNSDQLIGTTLLQHTSRDGERVSTNTAFIRPIRKKRHNLSVRPNSHVTRIIIDPNSKKAVGVEYVQKGKFYQILAKKEVILSAGAIDSPKVLMLSGIGPQEHLRQHGIQVVKDLPVGYNLQDHTTIDGVVFALTNHTATSVSDEQRKGDIFQYKETHRGPLSATGPLQANAFVQTKFERESDRPDIQYSMDAVNVRNFFTDPILSAETAVTPLSYYDGLMLRPILLNPKSRGVVQLNDTDPLWGSPLIFSNTFTQEIDLLRIVEGVKQSLNLLRTHTFEHLGINLVSTPLPACEHIPFGSDEYWACIAMAYTATIFHPVGTCKMGPKHDQSAVVDPHLRVYGIPNLRVIDASVMPKIVRGNTNAPTIMIAEKGSDMIKADWLHKQDGLSTNIPVHSNEKQIEDFDISQLFK